MKYDELETWKRCLTVLRMDCIYKTKEWNIQVPIILSKIAYMSGYNEYSNTQIGNVINNLLQSYYLPWPLIRMEGH